jgi:hypothetical protein
VNFWSNIKESLLSGVPQPLVLPDALVFNAIDKDAISVSLKLSEKAGHDGERDSPDTASNTLSNTESSIVAKITQVMRPYLQNYDSQQLAYESRLASLDPLGLTSKFRGEASLQVNELRVKIDQETGSFYLLKDSLTAIEADWREFKNAWNITVDPVISDNKNRGWLLLALLVAAEAILNGLLIGPYTELGVLSGVAVAAIFPIITLLCCGLASGNLIRLIVSPVTDRNKTRLAIILVIFLSLIAVLVNLWLAYTREAAATLEEWTQGLTLLLLTLRGDPQPFGAESLLLFIFSTALYAVAVVDVYRMKHPIPGLVEKFRTRQQKHKEFSSRLKKSHQDLIALQSVSTELFRTSFDTLNAWQIEYNQIQDARVKLWQRLQNYLNHVETSTNELLSSYREINESVRKTPSPKYFKRSWTFPEIDYRERVANENPEAYQNKLRQATEELEAIQREVNSVFEKIPEIVRGIDALLTSIQKP